MEVAKIIRQDALAHEIDEFVDDGAGTDEERWREDLDLGRDPPQRDNKRKRKNCHQARNAGYASDRRQPLGRTIAFAGERHHNTRLIIPQRCTVRLSKGARSARSMSSHSVPMTMMIITISAAS